MIDENLTTSKLKVKTLQTALHTKAKAEPLYRFYTHGIRFIAQMF